MQTTDNPSDMLKQQRQQRLLELVQRDGRVLATEIGAAWGVSEDTIRRDLREMAERGQVRRVHGGALMPSAGVVPYRDRERQDRASKDAIARAAARLIPDDSVVFIDGGTTTTALAAHLPPERRAMIVTNSLPLALALADHPAVSVRVLGGALLKEGRVTASTGTVNAIELVRADLCLLGMCGLHPETGITTSDAEEAHVKHAMISHAAETIGLISSGKLGTTMPYIVGPARLLSRIVTDTRDEAVLAPYTDLGLEIVTAG